MKNRVRVLLTGLLCFSWLISESQTSDLVSSSYGIWQTFGDPITLATTPELRGRLCNFRWADIEPSPNTWNWAQFDNDLAARAADSLPITFMVYTEEDAPEWIYSNGVPKVAMTDRRGNIVGYAPYYADQDYKDYFERMISAVRAHIDSLPNWVRTHIVAVQACLGSTGDYIGYKGDVDPQYFLNGNDFYDLFKEFTMHYYDAYKTTSPKIYLLSNPKNNGPDQINWLISNCPNSWIKTGTLGKGYQLNDEIAKSDWLYPILNSKLSWGDYMRSRSEIIGGGLNSGWWNTCPYRNMFTMFCYDIFWGLDWSNQGYDQLNDSKYDSAFGFYNKYAGEKNPGTSSYAMCAFRDGLNAADIVRFPEAVYGTATRTNTDRYKNIQQKFAANGARLDDPTTATLTELDNLSATGINDVGWDVFPGNYERYLHQIDANTTSVGYWNVSTADKNDMYGRFARGFDNANGKNSLYFDVDSSFLNGAPLNGKAAIMIDVVYLDKGNAGFKIVYDGVGNNNSTALSVTCGNTNVWKRASITIHDAYFGNRSINGSDFYIQSTTTADAIFALVELTRAQSAQQIGIVASALNPFDSICTTSSEYQTLYLNGNFLDGSTVVFGPFNGYSFSMDNGRSYHDSLVISNYGASFGEKIFVKFSPATVGAFSGTIPLTFGNAKLAGVNVKGFGTDGPVLTTKISNAGCSGSADGAIDLSASSGTEAFSYSWYGPSGFKSNTQDISGLAAGDYTVIVTARSGCKSTVTYTVNQASSLAVNLSANPITCKNGTTLLHVEASGGTEPYNGTGVFSVQAGTYNYIVTDSKGCNGNNSITIKDGTTLPPAAPVNINTADADSKGLCGGGSFNYSVAAVSQATSYTWTFPGNSKITSANTDSSNIIVSVPSAFNGGTLSVTANNACGISAPFTTTMNVMPQDVQSIAGLVSVNANQSGIEYKASPVIPGLKYVWTVPADATIQSGQNTPDIFVKWGSSNGKVSVQAINNCGTSKILSLNVNVVAQASLFATSLNAFGNVCVGSSGNGSFSISGTLLNGSDIVIGPLSGYGFATSQNGVYSSTIKISGYGSNINQTVYTKFSPSSARSYNGNIAISGGGVAAFSVQANGTGVAAPTLTTSVTDLSCNASNDGAISLLVNGGASPFTFTWTNNAGSFHASSKDLTSLRADTYIVTVNAGGGCTAMSVVTVNQPTALIVNAIAGNMGNNDSALVSVSASGGISPYLGTGIFSVPQGDYTYSVTDAAGCTSHATVSVQAASKPLNVTATAGKISCNGGTTTVNVSAAGGVTPYKGTGTFTATAGTHSYTVTDASGQQQTVTINIQEPSILAVNAATVITDSIGNATVSITANGGTAPYAGTGNFNVSAGTYTYQIADAAGCTADTTITINAARTILTATATPGKILCAGGTTTVTIKAAGGVAPYSGTGSFTVRSGIYTFVVTDASGENTSLTVNIPEPDPLAISINNSSVSACMNADAALTINATGGTTPYLYNINGGHYRNSNKFEALSAGNYTAIVKDNNGCIVSATTNITKYETLTARLSEINTVSSCANNDGSFTVETSGGASPFYYSIDANENTQSSNVFQNLTSGKYTVDVTDANGCTTSVSTQIAKAAPLDVTIKSKDFASACFNNDGSITVETTGGTAPFQYSTNGTDFQDANLLSGLAAGDYTIAVKDARGCMAQATAKVVQSSALSIALKDVNYVSACSSNDGSIKVGKEGGTAPFAYSINGGDYSSGNMFENLTAGIYSISVKDAKGCTASTVATVSRFAPINISVVRTEVTCRGGKDGALQINCTGGNGNYRYSINNQWFKTSNVFTNLSAGVYTVTVKDSRNCETSATVTIEDGKGTCSSDIPEQITTGDSAEKTWMKLIVLPNPTPTEFIVKMKGNNTDDVQLIVTDILGRNLYQIKGNIQQEYRFGRDFAPGTYILRVTQGSKTRTLKLIKSNG